jgi:ABC-2 type transport system permease protein
MLNIARYEFRYMFWSIPTLVAFTALFGFAALVTGSGAEFQLSASDGDVLINAPMMITTFLLVSSVLSIFIVPSIMATTVLKDTDSKFDAILYATPITKSDYLFGRFLGAFAALMLVMAAGPLGMLLGTFWPWTAAGTLAPTNLMHYLVVYFGFLMPSMMFLSALIFAVAVMSRSMMYCYVTVIGLFVFYIAGQGFVNIAGQVSTNIISPLWDPFMMAAFNDQIRYWTIAELNNDLISYTGIVLANRLLWLGIAIGLFATAYLRFSFRAPAKVVRARKSNRKTAKARIRARTHVGYRGTPAWDRSTHFRQFLFRTQFEVLAVMKSRPFILLMVFSLFLLVSSLSNRAMLYEVNALPVTRILVTDLMGALRGVLMVVTIFYGADIVWRDHENKFNQLTDATPTPNWVFVISKLVALVAVVFSIMILGVLVAVLIQISNGYYAFEFGLYLERSLLFGTTFIFLAVLSCFFQVLVKSRFLGIMLMGLFWIATIGSMGALGFEHPLLRYALGAVSSPLSDMNGSGRFIEASLWIRAYYASVAGLLVMLTYVLWNRGTLQPLKYRLKRLKAFRTAGYLVPITGIFIMFIGSGSFVFYNTNVLNNYRTRADIEGLRVAYEQQFRRYENLPMPRTVDVKMDVDIYPYRGRVETRGIHTLENKTDADISIVHIAFSTQLAAVPHVELEGASIKSVNELYRYYIFELTTPMVPGEQRRLEFETLIHNEGFPHRGPDVRLVRNGTFLDNRRLAPHIGFNPSILITDRDDRRDAGLEPLPGVPKLEDRNQYRTNFIRSDSDFITFEATVSTVANQIAVTPGYLQKEWTEGNRRYFHYEMDTPIMNFYSFFSADYETLRDRWNDVNIEIFHHQPHGYNLDRMMESAKDSLAYFSREFGPYQFQQLRILEFPAYRTFARSFPNTIAYSEDLGFLADVSDSSVIDVPYYVTAHEIAHQWWANQVMPANTQGASMLSETLSQYSALMVMEHKYGKDQIRKFLKFELDSYLSERNREAGPEVPLIRAEGQQYIFYRKGAVIMYALKDYLGEEVVNRALQRLLEGHAFKSSPYPTSADFLAYVKEEAGPEHFGLIEDFLEKITLFDIELTSSSVEEMADGRFKVSLDLNVAKFYSDGVGNQSNAAFDIPVDIGLFLKNPEAADFGAADVLMLEKRRVADGKSTIEIIVDQKPEIAGIDPYNKLIDRDSGDNLQIVEGVDEVAIAASSQAR